jgi:hypothetical protein
VVVATFVGPGSRELKGSGTTDFTSVCTGFLLIFLHLLSASCNSKFHARFLKAEALASKVLSLSNKEDSGIQEEIWSSMSAEIPENVALSLKSGFSSADFQISFLTVRLFS